MGRLIPYFTGAAAFLASGLAFAGEGAVADEWKWLTFAVFGGIIALTMYITWRASKRVHSTSRVLRRRTFRFGLPERLGDCRRLPVRRVLPGHRRPDLAVRL